MKKSKSQKTSEELLEEIKKLLILQLYNRKDASTKEIGKILKISYKTVERMLPKKSKRRTKKRK